MENSELTGNQQGNKLSSHLLNVINKNRDISDFDLMEEVKRYNKPTDYPSHSDTTIAPSMYQGQMTHGRNFFNDTLSEMSRMRKQFEQMWNHFDKEFQNNTNNSAYKYTKHSSSVTNIGEDGHRRSKVISDVERVENGKKTSTKKIITQNGNEIMIEEIFPNGEKRITKKVVNGKNLILNY